MGETKSTKNRREKGAITLFILIAMFFFLIVLYSLYANNVSRLSAQRNYVADIQKQYEETIDEEKIKEEYDKITSEKIRIVLYIASTGKIYSTDQWTNQNLKMEIAKELGVYDQVKKDGGWENVSSKTCGNIVTKAIEIANRAVE